MTDIRFYIYRFGAKWCLDAEWRDHKKKSHHRAIGTFDTHDEARGVYIFWLDNNSPEDLEAYVDCLY